VGCYASLRVLTYPVFAGMSPAAISSLRAFGAMGGPIPGAVRRCNSADELAQPVLALRGK
jgi:hypothetical protein